MDASIRIVVATLTLAGSVSWSGSNAQTVDLSVHGFRSDVTVPISDLTKQSLEYTNLLFSQALGMDFSASVFNGGPDTAYNVLVSLLATLDGTDLGTFSSDTLEQLAPGATDTLVIDAGLNIGQAYTVLSLQFNGTCQGIDTVPVNDQDSIAVHISDFLFSRTGPEWSDTIGSGEQGSIFLVRYEFLEEELICIVACIIPFDPELIGIPIVGGLYDEELNHLATTIEVTLYPSNMSEPGEAHLIIMEFPEPIEVGPDQDWYAAIETYAPMPAGFAAGEPCPDSSALRYDWETETWSMPDRTPFISVMNLNSGCYFGVEQYELTGLVVQPCIPDPASASTTIYYSNKVASNVRVEIRNSGGVVVEEWAIGKQGTGEHTFDLDVSALPSGVYSCSVIIDDARATRRLVVVH